MLNARSRRVASSMPRLAPGHAFRSFAVSEPTNRQIHPPKEEKVGKRDVIVFAESSKADDSRGGAIAIPPLESSRRSDNFNLGTNPFISSRSTHQILPVPFVLARIYPPRVPRCSPNNAIAIAVLIIVVIIIAIVIIITTCRSRFDRRKRNRDDENNGNNTTANV